MPYRLCSEPGCGARLRLVNKSGFCQRHASARKCRVCGALSPNRGSRCDDCKGKALSGNGKGLKSLTGMARTIHAAKLAEFERRAALKLPLFD